ncbi:MAG: sensor histidine kinase, partial [Chloroflexi bacterium]
MDKPDTHQNARYEPLQIHHLSHDLRGPLNSVLGFTELLLEGIDGPLNDVQKEDLTAIYQSGTQLLRLINAAVDAGKIDAGRLKLVTGPVSLHTAAQSAADTLAAAETPVLLSVNIPAKFPPVWADRDRVEEIISVIARYLHSLLKNGTIELSAEDGNPLVSVKLQANVVIPPEKLAHLFELNARVDAAGHSEVTEGGVFLPLAHRLARAQNGSLTVKSALDSGTVFELRLPRYRPESD